MKAVVHDRYGPPEVLRIEDVPEPTPARDEILVRVRATGVTRGDTHQRAGEPFIGRVVQRSVLRPRRRILGHELAGEVEAIGSDVTEFARGDRVFGALPYLALSTGAHAEYMCVPERFPVAHMPAGITFEEAGAICDGAMLTLNVLRPAGSLAGKRVLVYGASGSLGTASVQLAKHFGAHVTAVCKPEALELVRSLGADEAVDYTRDDFTKSGEAYDVIIDAVGKHHPYSFRHCRRSLNPGGAYLPTDGLRNVFLWLWHKRFGDKKVLFELPPRMRKEDVHFVKRLIEAGEYRPVIDRTYPLASVVDAHRYVEAGHKTGNVVLTVYDRYGPPDVLRVEDVDAPIPAADEILVRTSATTVNRTDCGWRSAKPFIVRWFLGLRRPKRRILGMEFAGTVEAAGPAVTEFAVGDEVFGVKGFGAHAELVCVRESGAVAHKPKGMSFDEAAAVCDGACIAVSCLRRAELRAGHRLVVYGASGSVGIAAVQIATHLGAHVTAVCNTQALELALALGADEVVDYLHEDFKSGGQRYDVIFDAVGKETFLRCRRSLAPGGIFVSTDGLRNLFWMFWTKRFGEKRAALGIARYRKDDVRMLKRLIERGEYQAVIDRRYPLADVVEAARYVDTGQKTGNVVLTV